MRCADCGGENRDGRKFCAACGARLAVACPACDAPNEPGEKFCGECGAPITVPGLASATDPGAASGARKIVTILFADLAGSTALHERLDPESVTVFMERYYRAMRGALEAHGGTVVKLLGDGVMAAFGVPLVAEDDAIRGVRAAVAMQQAFRELALQTSAAVGSIALRVALNTGEVVVSADNTDVVGDPVNVAARLQQEAGDGEVVAGESTQRLVAALATLAPLGSFALKGRAQAVQAYRVVSLERPQGAAATAFVGREEELARLTAVYQRAIATPEGALVVLLGSPGLGKSRLIDEFARRHGETATVIAAHCDAAGGATFAPLAVALRQLLGIEDGAGPETVRGAIQAVLPSGDSDAARVVGGVAALLTGSPAAPEETFFVVRRFLGGVARARPVVLVIDDLHWAEPLLLDLVEHLVQWGAGVPLFVLVGARPELRELRSSLARPGALVADVVTLAGLDAGAATRLAANVIGAADLPAAVAAKLLATSEGNPLFVGELMRMLVQEGALTKRGERWTVGANLTALEMPPTIQALLAARIERLRPEERSVLERAAVVGRHFSRGAVAALLPLDGGDLGARLESLRRSELIEPDSGWLLGEPVLRFHHVLIRDAAYRRLLKGTRAELHGRLADWIEAQVGEAAEHDETIGRHLEQAHQLLAELGPLEAGGRRLGERAAQRLAAAGRRALARDDLRLAASLLGRAIARLDAADPARADLALDWCEALLAAGDVGPAAQAIDQLAHFTNGRGAARDSAREGEAPAEPAAAVGRVAPVPSLHQAGREPRPPRGDGDGGGGGGYRERAEGDSSGGDGDPGEAGAARLRAWHTCFAGQLTVLTEPQALQGTADALAGAAAQLADLGDAAGEAKAHSVHAQALARLGKVGACEAALDRALAAARRAGDRRRANAVLAGAPVAALWGPSPVTRASGRCLDVVRVLRITQGAPAVEAVALSCQGVLEALRGRTDAARRMIASSRQMVEELGIAHRLLEADVFAGRIDLLEGDAVAAERHLAGAYAGLRELGLGIDAARAASLLGRALLAQGRAAEAEALSHESERLAGDDLQAAIAWRGVRAEALAQRGEHAAAIELAQAAVAIAAATDALLDHADARLAVAAALRAAGRGGEADAEQRRATELWETKGATLLAERARRAAQRESIPPAAEGRVAPARAARRPARGNAATASAAQFDAAFASGDLATIEATFTAAGLRVVDHPTGSTYGREGAIDSYRRLLRSAGPVVRHEPLATLGASLGLFRRRISAGGVAGGRFEAGDFQREEFVVIEPDIAVEIFAADRLADAIARLYQRHAELLPEGKGRERAAATARSVAAMVAVGATQSVDGLAAALSPTVESIDHRQLGLPPERGAAELIRAIRVFFDLAADVSIRTLDVFLEGNALLQRASIYGTDRASGGAFELPLHFLWAFDADGLLARWEVFDVEQLAEATARLDALTAGPMPRAVRRRVRANAAAENAAAIAAAMAAADLAAAERLLADVVEIVHHPSGSVYGRAAVIETFRRFMQAKGFAVRHEALATLGDRLALSREVISLESADDDALSAGGADIEIVILGEVDGSGRTKRSELFASDHLGAAIARLYTRYAELLPEGPARERAVLTARAVTYTVTDATTPDEALLFSPTYEDIDHRSVGYGTLSTDEARNLVVTQRALADGLRFRVEEILALRPDGLVRKTTTSGFWREGGGAFERTVCLLSLFGPDGRAARQETFDSDREAEALARFEALRPDPLRIPPNAAARANDRHWALVEAGDWDAVAALHAPSLVFDDRRRGLHTAADRDGYLAGLQWAGLGVQATRTLLATPGDRLALWRNRFSRTRDVLLYEIDTLAINEIDAAGRLAAVVLFDPDARAAADAELNERFLRSDMHHVPPGVVAFARAVNRRDLAGVRAALPDDFVLDDRRRIGLGRVEGVDAYLTSLQALLELTTDAQIGDLYQVVDAPHGRIAVTRASGTNREGGPFEILYVVVLRYRAGRLAVLEFHDLEDLDQVVSRFTALDPAGAP